MRKIIIFDWAGTLVDFGCKAPLLAFKQTLNKYNLFYTDKQINSFMGIDKRSHLHCLTNNINITNELYPFLLNNMKEYVYINSVPCPGTIKTLNYLKNNDWLIGSTSGYPRELLDIAIKRAKEYNMFIPYNVASDEVEISRPYAYQIYKNLDYFKINKKEINDILLIKVGDTIYDIEEGLNASAKLNIGISDNSELIKKMYKIGATHVISKIEDIIKIV